MTTRLTPVTIAGPAGALEGLLHEREGAQHAVAALVCHPHPLYGGTMHNKVVHRVGTALHQLGAAVLRFNFRGAGASEGEFDASGDGELADARAALDWLAGRHPKARLWLAGFSFGSWIASRLAASEPAIERLVLVAPPVERSSFEMLRNAPVPKLVVQGTSDDICSPVVLEQEFAAWAEPKQLILVPGAGHFFDRQLGPLGERLTEALA